MNLLYWHHSSLSVSLPTLESLLQRLLFLPISLLALACCFNTVSAQARPWYVTVDAGLSRTSNPEISGGGLTIRQGQAYGGQESCSRELGLLVRFGACLRQFVFANFNDERYANEIRNSPLMNASGISQVVLGFQFVLN
jgi:hypothetical protein